MFIYWTNLEILVSYQLISTEVIVVKNFGN